MSPENKYQLFVSNKCTCCDKILMFLKREKINVKTINIDEEDYNLPFSLIIIPALVQEKKLIGYGADDIMSYLKTG